MDHFYDKIQGWCDYFDLYKSILVDLPENFTFAEIGVWKGQSISYFTVESLNLNKQGTIYAIDHWKGSSEHLDPEHGAYEPLLQEGPDSLYNLFLSNIEPVKEKITVLRKDSVEASKDFSDNTFDAIFVDAGHGYNDVLQDLISWYPKVKNNGGIICGHDYDWSGVNLAVNSFFSHLNKPVFPASSRSWKVYKN